MNASTTSPRFHRDTVLAALAWILCLATTFPSSSMAANDAAKIQAWREAAEKGDAGAQCSLGVAYFRGDGVPIDFEQAVLWCRRAATQYHPQGCFNLGVAYQNGESVEKDEAKAVEWWHKAADLGDSDALMSLGRAYENGRGVTADKTEATVWYRKAAAKGDKAAKEKLAAWGEAEVAVRMDKDTAPVPAPQPPPSEKPSPSVANFSQVMEPLTSTRTKTGNTENTPTGFEGLVSSEMTKVGGAEDKPTPFEELVANELATNMKKDEASAPAPDYFKKAATREEFYAQAEASPLAFPTWVRFVDKEATYDRKADDYDQEAQRLGNSDPARNFQLTLKAAAMKKPGAVLHLGQHYVSGLGTKRDLKKAEMCYKVAESLGLKLPDYVWDDLKKP